MSNVVTSRPLPTSVGTRCNVRKLVRSQRQVRVRARTCVGGWEGVEIGSRQYGRPDVQRQGVTVVLVPRARLALVIYMSNYRKSCPNLACFHGLGDILCRSRNTACMKA